MATQVTGWKTADGLKVLATCEEAIAYDLFMSVTAQLDVGDAEEITVKRVLGHIAKFPGMYVKLLQVDGKAPRKRRSDAGKKKGVVA